MSSWGLKLAAILMSESSVKLVSQKNAGDHSSKTAMIIPNTSNDYNIVTTAYVRLHA